jgi:hypothetical protein
MKRAKEMTIGDVLDAARKSELGPDEFINRWVKAVREARRISKRRKSGNRRAS